MKNTKISVFKELFNSKSTPYTMTIEQVFERIKNGVKIQDLIINIRKSTDVNEKRLLKAKLPCIVFGGIFKERRQDGLVEHSGLMVLDYDHLKNKDEVFANICKNKHVVSAFTSPSGDGLKVVVKIPKCDKFKHSKYYKQFAEDFPFTNLDASCSNVDRVCFASFDPNIYINYEAIVYEPTLIDKGYNIKDRVPVLPVTDDDYKINKIISFKWQTSFIEGQRNNHVFALAGAFCEYGVTQTSAENYILNNLVNDKYTENEMLNAVKSAYKTRQFGVKYFENYSTIEKIKMDLKKGSEAVMKIYKIDNETFETIKEKAEIENFWFLNKDNQIKIVPLKFKIFLERNGFKKFFPNDAEKPVFVFIDSNKVELSSTAKIKDYVLDYLFKLKEYDVWNHCANYQTLFSDSFLLMLDSIDLLMLTDKYDKSYIAFKNGILEVTKHKAELVNYIDVEGYIWKSHIIDRNWERVKDFNNDYSSFIQKVSNFDPIAVESVIGYLLSTYKNRSNNKAIILNDEEISDNPEGGTGKGLFIQGVAQIRKTSIIDGKQLDNKKSFPYQTVSIDTKILVFDDVKKNFDFEDKFSLVTEGITLERKNKDAIKMSVNDSPKLVLSTNYAIKGEGNSHNRRRHEIEFSQYYNAKVTPEDDFKRQLFDDWDDTDYLKFDNYMVYCLQLFLNKGLLKPQAKNIKLRKLIAETCMEFYEFANDTDNISLNIRHEKTFVFDKFIGEYKDFQRLTRKRFNIWVQKYATFMDYKYSSGNTNAERWFMIEDGKPKVEEELSF